MSFPRVDYDDRQHLVYAAGRALSPSATRAWIDAFASHMPARTTVTVADIGSGTGRFSILLASNFDSDVVGVEPSARMREVAAKSNKHPRIRYLDGAAERIPLPAESSDVALLSDVLHHVQDPSRCVHELARILRPGGLLFIRGVRPERLAEMLHFTFFPSALPIAQSDALTTEEVRELFAQGGFRLVAHDIVQQQTAPSLSAYAERISLRAISYLEALEDVEFTIGLERLRQAASGETRAQPVVEGIDLLVLQLD